MSDTRSQISLLAQGLDVASLRHRTIAGNLANINTPGYTRLEVAFEDELAGQMDGGAGPRVVESPNGPQRADGNNVSIEQEMSDLNKNTLLYTALAQFLSVRVALQRSSISGQ